jgi:hypothetical protein
MEDDYAFAEMRKLVWLCFLPTLLTCAALLVAAYFVKPTEIVYKDRVITKVVTRTIDKMPTDLCKLSTGVVQTVFTEKVNSEIKDDPEAFHWESDVTFLLDNKETLACHYKWGNLKQYIQPGMRMKTYTAGSLDG